MRRRHFDVGKGPISDIPTSLIRFACKTSAKPLQYRQVSRPCTPLS